MSKLSAQIEAIFLVANRPLSLKELSTALQLKTNQLEEELNRLSLEYQQNNRGWRLIKAAHNYQLVSAGEHSEILRRFLKSDTSGELSQPSLEALTIIAYRGPVTKLELERIRGVNCSLIIRNLLLRGLIEESFDKQKNENYYQVTLEFLHFLNLSQVEDLPDYGCLHEPEELKAVMTANEEL